MKGHLKTVTEPKTILVVDDDPAILGLVRRLLERGDYHVLAAHDGESALRVFEGADRIDLMLLDVAMPDISGPDLAEKILASDANLKVLFMSAGTDSEQVRLKVFDLAFGFLAKPFTSEHLLQSVRDALGRPNDGLRTANPPTSGEAGEGCRES